MTRTSTTNERVAWLVNLGGPHGIDSIRNGFLEDNGYTATFGSDNLIVENIMMNDVRNDSMFQCVITLQDTTTILRESDQTILYIAGTYVSITVRVHLHNYICVRMYYNICMYASNHCMYVLYVLQL